MYRGIVFGIVAFSLIIAAAFSATIYVPDDYGTIQGAIDAAANGDEVIVRPGTYVENIDFVGKAIVVRSEQGASVTTIDGNQAGRVVTFNTGEEEDSELYGFTVTNGDSSIGGGIYCWASSPTIGENTIAGNMGLNGGGIYCASSSSPTITNNNISGNTADDGGGICCNSSSPTIANNTITGNTGVRGGGINCGNNSSPSIMNNTLTENIATHGGAIYCYYGSPTVTNTILWENSAQAGPEIYINIGSPSVTYCDVEGGWSGTGNIDTAPLFVDPANGDFHLQFGSPCINAGDPNSPLDPDGTRADMGAFYYDQSGFTWYVPDDYTTIQYAISAAGFENTIVVRPGTYYENIDFLGKSITVKSESGPSVTIIDGGQAGSVVRFVSGEDVDAVLNGFTINNGSSGGIYCSSSSPTVTNNTISGNTANVGGGIYCSNSSPIFTNNTISGNTANEGGGIFSYHATLNNIKIENNSATRGGGIFSVYSTLEDLTVVDNTAYRGGGVYFSDDNYSSSSAMTNSEILRNSAAYGAGIYCPEDVEPTIVGNLISENNASSYGGGICCSGAASSPMIDRNEIALNTSEWGAGLFCDHQSSPTVLSNVIVKNTSSQGGGGIFCYTFSDPSIANNIVVQNEAGYYGGGLAFYNSLSFWKVTNNTIVWNTVTSSYGRGGGVYCAYGSAPVIVNTILWGNAATTGKEVYLRDTSSLTISCSDVEGGQTSVFVEPYATLNWGAGMLEENPIFVGPADEDFHLTWTSPCRNAGDSTVWGLPDKDYEGDPRIAVDWIDIGADEFYYHLYYVGDVVPGDNITIRVVGGPNMPVKIYLGVLAADPTWTQHGYFYLEWPPVWEGVIGKVQSNGVLSWTVTVPTTWSSGEEHFLQALVGPWGGAYTRLTNLTALTVE